MRQSKRRNGGTRRNLFSFTGTCPAPTGVGPTADGEHDAAHAKRAARVTVLTMKSASQRERERDGDGWRRERPPPKNEEQILYPAALSQRCMHGLFTWKWKHTIGHADVILGSGQSAVHSLHSPT